MKILNVNVVDGPNIWSIRTSKLIEVVIDLEKFEYLPSNKILNFSDNFEKSIPSMISHKCSENFEGGLFKRIKEGTWMGHIMEHLAIELQTLAGTNVTFGRTRETKTPGVYFVVFSYVYREVGIKAAYLSKFILEQIIDGKVYDPKDEIRVLRSLIEIEKSKEYEINPKLDYFDKKIATYKDLKYHIGLSFAGEDREYVKTIAENLKKLGILVFYDEFETDKLWGKDLYSYLSDIYSKKCLFCIVFISKHYATKSWTKHELRNAQERAFLENREYILPIRIDNTEISGINSTIGYIDATYHSVDKIVELIYNKILDT